MNSATQISTQLAGGSTCTSGGPFTVTLSYRNDTANAIVQTDSVQWAIPGNFGMGDGLFAFPSTTYTVSFSVADGSGHVFLSGGQNVTTPPAR